jgi:tetratricopeptide (TPR) repeat protein
MIRPLLTVTDEVGKSVLCALEEQGPHKLAQSDSTSWCGQDLLRPHVEEHIKQIMSDRRMMPQQTGRWTGVVLWLAAVLLVAGAGAATRPVLAQGIDSTLVGRFQLAQSYLRAGQFDRAISLLEELYLEAPHAHVFYLRLKDAYESVKRYDDAIALVEQQLSRNRVPVTFQTEKARLLYLKGAEDQALVAWDSAVELSPEVATTYRTVYQSMLSVRLFEEATGVLLRGRDRLQDPALFDRELGYLYGLTGEHELAMEEYLGLLSRDPRQLGYVRSSLARTLEQVGSLDSSIRVAQRHVRIDPLNRSVRELLAWLYQEAGRYADAYRENRAIDRLEGEDGRVLFGFAARAASAGAYDVAREAYEEISARYPKSQLGSEALRGIGDVELAWARKDLEVAFTADGERLETPHYDSALESFRKFVEMFPNSHHYPFVMLDIARVQKDVFFFLPEAEIILADLTSRFPGHPAADQAEYELGVLAVLRGDLEDARLIFERIRERLRIGDDAERARYEIALVHFYRGEFEAARTLVEAMKENTSTDMANDAISLRVLLLENRGPDSLQTPLRMFARSHLEYRRRHLLQSESALDSLLAHYGSHPLADEAHHFRGLILRDQGRFEEAAVSLAELPLIFPTSYLADRSLFDAARIREAELRQPERALELYNRLLLEYPASLLIPDVRNRIRTLRADNA